MKSLLHFLKSTTVILIIVVTFYANNSAKAQTGFCTVLQQPCNSDGILVTTITSGLTPPLTFEYGNGTHSNVLILTDTMYNISSGAYVYIHDNFGNDLLLNTGIVRPFLTDYPLVITNPVCPNTSGTINITIDGGNMPASVTWYEGHNWSPGPLVGSGNPMTLSLGTYCAYVTDINGCGYFYPDTNISIYQTTPIHYNVNTTDANCTNGTATITNITGGIAPYSTLWSNGLSTSTISNLTSGYYNLTVTDAQNCTSSQYFSVNQSTIINANTSITHATCTNNNGSVITFGSGGTPPYTYIYSNGATSQSINNLAGNTNLQVTVTDANQCTKNNYIYIGINTPIIVNYSATPSSCTTPTGSVTLNINGGTLPYSIVWFTSPLQTGSSIINMPAGNYSFKVTDAVGCERTGTAIIYPLSDFYSNPSAISPTCPINNNGSITLFGNGTEPPFTYLWSNGANTSTISNLSPGYYICTITDNIGCTFTRCQNLILLSPVHIGFNVTAATCLYNHDGSITANPTGGTPPYSFSWSNGQNTATINGLEKGFYWCNVIDANGCSKWEQTYVDYNHNNDSCYCTITGRVFVDNNTNCIYNTGEDSVQNIMVHCSPFGYSFTNNQGYYSFKVPTGSYTISEVVQYIYPLASCQNNSIPLTVTASSGCADTINFANYINPLHDIHIRTTNFNPAIPGNNYYHSIIVENDGTVPESNIQLSNSNDGQLQYLSTSPVALNQPDPINEPNWYNITSGFPTLLPGQGTMLLSNYFVPTNIPINTTVNFWDTTAYNPPMNNWLSDYSPWNNVNDTQIVVIGPFDPNYKEVFPKGVGSQGYISNSDSVLDYIIHFQNIGNYFAQNVVIIDTIDSDLDLSTLRLGFSNKNYIAEMNENRVLKFTFNNIHLYPENWEPLLSCGLVCYSINQNPLLNDGAQIKNSADIYFDYNAPVKTNTTINTIKILGSPYQGLNNQISLYPNPASTEIFVMASENNILETIYIQDMTGRLLIIKNISNSSTQQINIEKLTSGIYFITAENQKREKFVKKFIKD
ncbi:MAG: T9SS type A sorting domain-containing protein [Bacteroidia bacterium]|nr:T9SS type A sorting domain-containing protein [Bacteroidia bacterium]